MFRVKNRNRVLWLLRRMGTDVQNDTKRVSGAIARRYLKDVRSAAKTPREHIMVSSATVRSHLVPMVSFGGSTLMATIEPVTAGKLFYGTEFGNRWKTGHDHWYAPHRGKEGYLLFPTLRSHGKEYGTMWARAIERALDKAAAASGRV
jgi:hypothetical protein